VTERQNAKTRRKENLSREKKKEKGPLVVVFARGKRGRLKKKGETLLGNETVIVSVKITRVDLENAAYVTVCLAANKKMPWKKDLFSQTVLTAVGKNGILCSWQEERSGPGGGKMLYANPSRLKKGRRLVPHLKSLHKKPGRRGDRRKY